MTHTPEGPAIEFLVSNLSLPPRLMALGSIDAHKKYLESIGADGLEVVPTHIGGFMRCLLERATVLRDASIDSPLPDNQDRPLTRPTKGIEAGSIEEIEEDNIFRQLIRSLHSSFRNDTVKNRIIASTVPHWQTSLEQMANIQHLTGQLPAVLYPHFENGTVVYSDANAPFSERTFQPKASDWQRMGLMESSSIPEIQQVIESRGFTGITWDLFHCQVDEEGEGFKDAISLARRLATAGLIHSVHLSLNRSDPGGIHMPLSRLSRHAKLAFLQSAERAKLSLEGEMLCEITKASHEAAKEVAGSSPLKRIILEEDPLRAGRNSRRSHTAIIEHARQLIADI